MFRAIAALLCIVPAATASLPAGAGPTFTLRDYVNHTWTNELVTYQVRLPHKLAERAELIGPGGKRVPVQVRRLGGDKCEVAFLVEELPADGAVSYALRAGKPAGETLLRDEGDSFVLDAGPVAARVPRPGELKFEKPVRLEDVAAPLLAMRARSGVWIGSGRMLGRALVTVVRSRITASGPVYAESRTEYGLRGGRYAMTVRVVRGQDAVIVSEEFDTWLASAGKPCFSFELSRGLLPDRVAAEIREWRRRTDETTNVLGSDYRLDFDEDRMEMSILGYINWWPETAMRATFYRSGDAGGDAISVIPARIGRWRNPMGMYVMTTTEHGVCLRLPIYIDQDWVRDGVSGGPYYTGRLEPGWPRTAGRREWVLHAATVSEALGQDGPSSVLEATRKYSSLPLDKVKDWVLDWKTGPAVTYPRLFIEPGKLGQIAERIRKNERWAQRLRAGSNPALAYAIFHDPQTGRDLVFKGDPEDQTPYAWQRMGALQSLRQYTRLLMRVGYLGERWGTTAPNNGRPMQEMIEFDAAMGVAGLSGDTRAEMRHLMAFIANVVYDEDWNPTKAGFHRGNVNMPPRHEHHLGMASCVLPDHPLARAWRQRALAEQRWMMKNMVRPGGAWRECPSYQMDAAHLPLFQAAIPIRYSSGPDIFRDARLKASWDYLLNLSTPPDARFGVRVLPAFGNGTWLPAPFFGWLAALTRGSDPAFSARMQWMWLEQGKPDWYPFSEALIEPHLPAKQPRLASRNFPGFGAILRSGFPSANETWLAYRIGENVEHYNYGDQGSFMLYAKGAPLILHFGSIYSPQFRGAWYFNRVSIGHQEVRPGMFGGTELWGHDEPDYTGKVIDFEKLGAADYVVGRHVQSRQGLIPDDARTPTPLNAPTPRRDIPRHIWTRQIMLVKSFAPDGREDPLGPGYVVMKDNIESADPLPSEWNVWTWVDGIDLEGNLARCQSPYGVELDIFMADPASPRWETRGDTTTSGPGGGIGEHWRMQNNNQPWRETLKNLRAYQAPGGGFLAVLYPRRSGEAAPQLAGIAAGAGVSVTHPRGRDSVFLGLRPAQWSEGDRKFDGTAGAIRQEGDRLSLVLPAPGEVSAAGYTLRAAGAASLTVRDGVLALVTGKPGQDVQITRPGGPSRTVRSERAGEPIKVP